MRDERTKAVAEWAKDRWGPVLGPNGTYCSPACGYKCTKAAFDRATEAAAILAARMGKGWSPRVWENLGWHYEVVNGIASLIEELSKIRKGKAVPVYTLYFNTVKQIVVTGNSPKVCVTKAIRIANDRIYIMQQDLKALEKAKG